MFLKFVFLYSMYYYNANSLLLCGLRDASLQPTVCHICWFLLDPLDMPWPASSIRSLMPQSSFCGMTDGRTATAYHEDLSIFTSLSAQMNEVGFVFSFLTLLQNIYVR